VRRGGGDECGTVKQGFHHFSVRRLPNKLHGRKQGGLVLSWPKKPEHRASEERKKGFDKVLYKNL